MKSICFIVDDVNFQGGAHVATYLLIKRIVQLGVKVEILTLTKPDDRTLAKLDGVKIKVMPYPMRGIRRLVCGLLRRVGWGWYPVWAFDPRYKWHRWASNFNTVCCVGEPSILRWFTASLPRQVRKVIMIHTDYSRWRRQSHEARRITRLDGILYRMVDVIGIVGVVNAEKMKQCMPSLRQKIKPFHNIIDIPKVTPRLRQTADRALGVKIVTLSRLEWGPPKKTDALIRVAAGLKSAGIKFDWDVYGSGDKERLEKLVAELGVGDVFHMRGFSKDAQGKLAGADISVMLSDYEGLSNGIYESMMLGVPVFSTNVGGASEQIQDGVNGWLVENNEDKVFEKLKFVLNDMGAIERAQQSLSTFRYNNAEALKESLNLLGLSNCAIV